MTNVLESEFEVGLAESGQNGLVQLRRIPEQFTELGVELIDGVLEVLGENLAQGKKVYGKDPFEDGLTVGWLSQNGHHKLLVLVTNFNEDSWSLMDEYDCFPDYKTLRFEKSEVLTNGNMNGIKSKGYELLGLISGVKEVGKGRVWEYYISRRLLPV